MKATIRKAISDYLVINHGQIGHVLSPSYGITAKNYFHGSQNTAEATCGLRMVRWCQTTAYNHPTSGLLDSSGVLHTSLTLVITMS